MGRTAGFAWDMAEAGPEHAGVFKPLARLSDLLQALDTPEGEGP